jgi:hypothetical protein
MSFVLTHHTSLSIIDDEIQRFHENHDDGSVTSMERVHKLTVRCAADRRVMMLLV